MNIVGLQKGISMPASFGMFFLKSLVCSTGNTHAPKMPRSSLLVTVGSFLLISGAWSAETSLIGGGALNYKYDDNLNVSPVNELSLSGWILDGFLKGQYATPRFRSSAELKLDFERYDRASFDGDDVELAEPDPADFDSDNQDLKINLAYDWERSAVTVFGRYWRDSVLNTEFLDAGFGGPLQVEGASRRTEYMLSPGWDWQVTERQSLNLSLTGQIVDYQDDRYIGYDYATLSAGWTYILTERMNLQVQPYFSWYKNEADIDVESRTFGLQVGFAWSITERWQLNALGGGTRVYTKYGQDGLVQIEDQDSNSFIGDVRLGFTEERYGFNASASSRTTPSSNGVLQQQNTLRALFYWLPVERMRLDLDSVVGQTSATDDRIDNGRDYREAGVRFAYQFLSNWWLSARYRFREQQYDFQEGQPGRGNSLFFTLSYRLPKEIL